MHHFLGNYIMTSNELLCLMLRAPAEEIENMLPSAENAKALLGLPDHENYIHALHYPILLAKMRRIWAIEMSNEANR